jgi:hypothetical protein
MSLNPRFYVSQSEILCLSIRDFISLNPRFYVSQSEILCLSIRDFISLLNNLVPNVASILSKYYKPFSHSTLYTFEKERRKKKKRTYFVHCTISQKLHIKYQELFRPSVPPCCWFYTSSLSQVSEIHWKYIRQPLSISIE